MNPNEIQSPAFRHAALKSEQRRALWLIVTLLAALILIAVRALTATTAERNLLPGAIIVVLSLGAYESIMYFMLQKRIVNESQPPQIFWTMNLLVETLFPTAVLLMVVKSDFLRPFDALLIPAGLFYFYFMILSILRLSPLLARLTGIFSAIGYLGVLVFVMSNYPPPAVSAGDFPLPIYFSYAFFLLVGGLVAGEVAREIRSHVIAALREAETRRQIEKIENDLEIARSIQQGLLPSESPELDGFDLAGWSQPADATGGDYYDWMVLPDGRLMITLADVTGHGVGPAMVSAVCRAYTRARVDSNESLSHELSFINELLEEDLSSDRFVTFVVALLDQETATLQILSAGHAPLFYYTAEKNRVETFEAHGIPLGLMGGYEYGDPQEFIMEPGDMLILVTDGFYEWHNEEAEEYGEKRLSECIVNVRNKASEEIIAELYTDVRTFAGETKQEDDLTAVILKRT